MNIVVTGSDGFIGKHLVTRLLNEGHRVTKMDSRTGIDILGNVTYLFENIDVVFHLAALSRPQESINNPVETNRVNVEGTLKILMHCKNNKVKRLVFASTTGLYGEQKVFPTAESATLDPMSPYALQKLVGEQYCKLFEKMYGLEVNIIRPFNVYGLGQDPKGTYAAAVPSFINSLKNNKVDWISGDGEQSRDFVYVDDVVDLMMKMAFSKIHGETFNAGSGVSTSINALYWLIAKIMDKNIKPRYVEAVYEPRKTQGDISKAENLLGWKPEISLEKGLRRIIND